MSPRLATALDLIANDIPVFPLQPGTKKPYPGSRGFKDATTNEAKVRAWFEHEDPNIGFRPWDAGLVVLDLDTYHGHDAAEAAYIEKRAGYVVQARGKHCYFQADKAYANTKYAQGIDVRGGNGYVLAPGSVVDGVEYRVIRDGIPGPLPPRVADKLAEVKPKEVIPQEDLEDLDHPANIERALDYLNLVWPEEEPGYAIACKLLDMGLSPDKATELFDYWSHGLAWSWSTEDIESKVAHAWQYRQNRGSSPLAADTTPPEEAYADMLAIEQKATRERFALVKPSAGPALAEIEFWDEAKTLPKGQVIVTYGDWGAHKTNIKLAQWLRTGARVVYAAGEGSHGVLKLRIPAQAAALGVELAALDERFAVVRAVPLLTSKADVEAFAAAIRDFKPDVVVIDTLATATAGSDENAAVWSAILTDNGAVGYLKREFGTVDIIAHSGKDAGRGVRGHSGALGNADAGLVCRVHPNDHVEMFVDKMRDGKDKFSIWWRIDTSPRGVPIPVPCERPKTEAGERERLAYEIIERKGAHSWANGLDNEKMATESLAARPSVRDELATARYDKAHKTETAEWRKAARRLSGLNSVEKGELKWWAPTPG